MVNSLGLFERRLEYPMVANAQDGGGKLGNTGLIELNKGC